MPATRSRRAAARTASTRNETFDLLYAPGHLLRRANQRSHEIFNQRLGAFGVTRQQTALMIASAQNPGASQQRLSAATGFDRNTLAEIADRLKANGLIALKRSRSDGRAYEVSLTRKGAKLIVRILPGAFDVQRIILEPLPPRLRGTFVRCLRILLGLDATSASRSGGRRGKGATG